MCVCVCLHFIRQLIPFTSSIDIELQAAQLIGPGSTVLARVT